VKPRKEDGLISPVYLVTIAKKERGPLFEETKVPPRLPGFFEKKALSTGQKNAPTEHTAAEERSSTMPSTGNLMRFMIEELCTILLHSHLTSQSGLHALIGHSHVLKVPTVPMQQRGWKRFGARPESSARGSLRSPQTFSPEHTHDSTKRALNIHANLGRMPRIGDHHTARNARQDLSALGQERCTQYRVQRHGTAPKTERVFDVSPVPSAHGLHSQDSKIRRNASLAQKAGFVECTAYSTCRKASLVQMGLFVVFERRHTRNLIFPALKVLRATIPHSTRQNMTRPALMGMSAHPLPAGSIASNSSVQNMISVHLEVIKTISLSLLILGCEEITPFGLSRADQEPSIGQSSHVTQWSVKLRLSQTFGTITTTSQ